MPTKEVVVEKEHLSQDIKEAPYRFDDPVFGEKRIVHVPKLTEQSIPFLLTPSVCTFENCPYDALESDPGYASIEPHFLSDRKKPYAEKMLEEMDRAEFYENLDAVSKKAVATSMKEHIKLNHLLSTKKVWRPGERNQTDWNGGVTTEKIFDRKAMLSRARQQATQLETQTTERGGQLVE